MQTKLKLTPPSKNYDDCAKSKLKENDNLNCHVIHPNEQLLFGKTPFKMMLAQDLKSELLPEFVMSGKSITFFATARTRSMTHSKKQDFRLLNLGAKATDQTCCAKNIFEKGIHKTMQNLAKEVNDTGVKICQLCAQATASD